MLEHFRVIAIRETHNWDADTLAEHGIREAFGLYLIREDERTHICSLTPSSRADFIRNAFIGGDPDEHDLEYEGDTPGNSSYLGFIDVKNWDPRFMTSPITVKVDGRRKEDPWDKMAELDYYPEPAILCEGTFDAWAEEQRLKRRAENRKPLDLPLFSAAVSTYEEARALNWI
jgi:hypothetical protein